MNTGSGTAERNLVDLIDQRGVVDSTDSVERVERFFRQHTHEFAAVVGNGMTLGLCSRSHVRSLLGGSCGSALYQRQPIGDNLKPGGVLISVNDDIREVLDRALSRPRANFYDDVILIDSDRQFMGLISLQTLVSAQSALMDEQLRIVAEQQQQLQKSNTELSESLKLQQELERHIVEKERAVLLHSLAGGVAHELNNKLMPIVGYAQLLQEELSRLGNEKLKTYCKMMAESGFEASRVIRQLLQLSKPAATEVEPCDLRAVVQQSLALVALRLKESGTTVDLVMSDDPIRIRADAGQIKQVMLNLVLNAIDAMEGRDCAALTVSLGQTETSALLAITDQGAGIELENLPRVFDPFFTTKAPHRGTGLGLSVCHSIVKQHGGEIHVDSTPGVGTTFRLSFPLDTNVVATAIQVDSSPRTAGPLTPSSSEVLVVEDDDRVAAVICDVLETLCGCQITRVADGRAGVEALESLEYSMIVSDVRMPVMNGAEFLDWIETNRPELLPRLFFVTGDSTGSDLNASIENRGVTILRKPLKIEALVAQFQKVLHQTTGLNPQEPLGVY